MECLYKEGALGVHHLAGAPGEQKPVVSNSTWVTYHSGSWAGGISGSLKICPQILWYSFPEVELNSLPLQVDWTYWLASNKQSKVEVTVPDIWDEVIKALRLPPVLTLLDHSLCLRTLKLPQRKVHVMRSWGLFLTISKELKLSTNSHVSGPPWEWPHRASLRITAAHVRPGARTTQLSCSWIPGLQKLRDNKCSLF